MAIRLKSALRIPKQQSLLAVRALLFASSLWLLADQDFSVFQLFAFVLIGTVLYFTPVFQTLIVLPSFLTLMVASPIAMSVFGYQVSHPFILAAFFGLLFYLLLGIKQVVFANRVKVHHALHLALFYCLSILFFAAPAGNWFVARSLALALFSYILMREFFIIRGLERGAKVKFISALVSFLLIEAVWSISLLPLGFINAAGTMLVFVFTLEELIVLSIKKELTRRTVALELATFAILVAVIFAFSKWIPV